jgi:gephyrin
VISHAQASNLQQLEEGSIARITTGAPLPPGTNAVIMVEDTILKSMTQDGNEENEVEILTDAAKAGENVREVGSDVQDGETIMRKGEGISVIGGELGLLASVGVTEVTVYEKPVIGVLSTGDEIIPHHRAGPLRLGEVRDTNRPTLLTAIRGWGFDGVDLGIASDKYVLSLYLLMNVCLYCSCNDNCRPGTLESTLRTSFQTTDIIITTGGVSMGELDLLKPTIERSLGGTLHFGRVNMKPGKPTTFGSVSLKTLSDGTYARGHAEKLIFSLPGNPASAIVTFHLFVLPCLHAYSGIVPSGLPKVSVTLEQDVRCDNVRPEYQRAVLASKVDANGALNLFASSTGMQRSSRIGSFKGANALLCLPAGGGVIAKGAKVEALIMGPIANN